MTQIQPDFAAIGAECPAKSISSSATRQGHFIWKGYEVI